MTDEELRAPNPGLIDETPSFEEWVKTHPRPSAQHKAECDCPEFYGGQCMWPRCSGWKAQRALPVSNSRRVLFALAILGSLAIIVATVVLTVEVIHENRAQTSDAQPTITQ